MCEDYSIKSLEYMWTTHLDQFVLVQTADELQYGIIRIWPDKTISSVIIENNRAFREVKQRLLDAGARMMTFDEFIEFRDNNY